MSIVPMSIHTKESAMAKRHGLSHEIKWFSFIIGTVILFNTNLASGDAHLSVQVSDPSALQGDFKVDGKFVGCLSDYIQLADGDHDIEVFGPEDQRPRIPQEEWMLYNVSIRIEVKQSKPEFRSIHFNTFCMDRGTRHYVKEWPNPVILSDERFPGAYRLVIANPIVTRRDTPCDPPSAPIMAPRKVIGVLKLVTSSTPPGAEVWVDSRFAGKTNSAINVPYHYKKEKIDVVIRAPGSVNCNWTLEGPFKDEMSLNCSHKTPGSH